MKRAVCVRILTTSEGVQELLVDQAVKPRTDAFFAGGVIAMADKQKRSAIRMKASRSLEGPTS